MRVINMVVLGLIFSLAAAPLGIAAFCSYSLKTTPEGADVYMDGTFIGTTPVFYVLGDEAVVTIRVEKEGYEVLEYEVIIPLDDIVFDEKTLTPLGQQPGMPRIVLLANSIDYDLASDFFMFLENKGLEVVRATAADFDQHKGEKFIVILGGPDAYEGVGEIVQEVLSTTEQDSVRESGARKMYVKTGVWAPGQRVTVLAGSDREQTREAHRANRDKVIEWSSCV